MRNKIKGFVKCCSIVGFILVIGIVSTGCYNINNLPEGDFISSLKSPDEKHQLNAYVVNEHATVALSVRVELVNLETNEVENIYWGYRQSEANMKWLDDETVVINERKLNIYNDKYDWRIDGQ